MLEATDVLVEKMRSRHRRLTDLVDRFGDFCRPRVLIESNPTQIGALVDEFSKEYSDDVCRDEMKREMDSLLPLIAALPEPPKTGEDLFRYLSAFDEDVCPNLRTAISILLTIGASIAGCERSFSKMKLILTYLRSSMGQERLSNLAILSIEKRMTAKLNYDDVVRDFVNAKVRRSFF